MEAAAGASSAYWGIAEEEQQTLPRALWAVPHNGCLDIASTQE